MFCFCCRGFTLDELLASIEDDGDRSISNISKSTNHEVPITLMSLTNACELSSDEDSRDEDFVSINNLPYSQLRSEAEITTSVDDDVDDDVPLSVIQLDCKKSKTYH